MQRLLARLSWRNINIGAKISVLFSVFMVVAVLLVMVIRVSFNTLRVELETGGATTVEMRALTQDIRLGLEALQRLEVRLVEQRFGWDSFSVTETRMREDYLELSQELLSDTTSLTELSKDYLTNEDFIPVFTEIRTVEDQVAETEEYFNRILTTLDLLIDAEEGAVVRLQQLGDDLEEQTRRLNDNELLSQVILVRSYEQALIDNGEFEDMQLIRNTLVTYSTYYKESIPLSRRNDTVLVMVDHYIDTADEVLQLLSRLNTGHSAMQLRFITARDAAARLDTITEAQWQNQIERLDTVQESANLTSLIGVLVMLVIGVGLTIVFAQGLNRTGRELLKAVRQMEIGDFSARAPVPGEDEFSQLGASFNKMASQLSELVVGLEQRVAERTRDLTITADIGRAVVAHRDPRSLMNEVVELIRQRFGFYHAQVFLIDAGGVNANLIASTGTAGRELLARQHSLAVGSQSVIGQVTASGQPVVAYDTGASGVVHRPNPLLPDTRSEMALPMRIGDRIIGALDVQSVAPNAFDDDTVAVFQIMADQLAISLDNARLQTELEYLSQELESVEKRITGDMWAQYKQVRSTDSTLAFEYADKLVREAAPESAVPIEEALQSGKIVSSRDNGEETILAVPIKIRGEVIGAFGFGGESLAELDEDDYQLIETIVDRVGMALDNLRLTEESARRAQHEQLLNEITAKIVGSTDVNYILQTTVKELGRVLRAPQTSVQLRPEGTDS